uniref:FadR/GntR family transcriptional regulator n=1 Tax=Altererythrobacter segetis TaxID=1104773 RepID=UPI0014085C36|nr:FadR/GntR family transcriptional regulator [Altererythrobacter segetis]
MPERAPGSPSSLRLHTTMARNLGTAIVSGEFQPGDNLGGEVERSETLGVSRTAYREAIRILIAKGLVESRPKAGTHVTPRKRWNVLDPDVLDWMFSGQPDEQFIHDIFELRGVIEPAAAAFAAERHTAAHLEIMDRALVGMREHGLQSPEGQEADQDFHTAILNAAGNEALASLSSSVGAAVRWTTRFKLKHAAAPRDPIDEHVELRDAIASRDPERAIAATRELLSLALQDMALVLV